MWNTFQLPTSDDNAQLLCEIIRTADMVNIEHLMHVRCVLRCGKEHWRTLQLCQRALIDNHFDLSWCSAVDLLLFAHRVNADMLAIAAAARIAGQKRFLSQRKVMRICRSFRTSHGHGARACHTLGTN